MRCSGYEQGEPSDHLVILVTWPAPICAVALVTVNSRASIADRLDEPDGHLVVLPPGMTTCFRQLHDTGDVRGAEVELRAVVVERRVTATLVLDRM